MCDSCRSRVSIRRFLFYKRSNPPGLGGSVLLLMCYKHANLPGLEEGVNFPVDHSCCYMLVS